MTGNKKKIRFEVKENETIAQCLERMKKSGYIPVGRFEKPIFKEIDTGGIKTYQPVGRTIIFEGKKSD